jgi:hypothetical protein
MTFFYDLNKRLAQLADKQDAQHLAEHATPADQQPKKGSLAQALNERDMSRAAKGYEKYGKEGMQALAKAGREGKALDPVRNKYDKYDESQLNELSPELLKKARDKAGMKYADADDRGDKKASDKYNRQDDKFNSALRKKQKDMAEAAKYRDPKYKDKLYTQEPPDYNDTREYDNAMWDPKPDDYAGRKRKIGGGEFSHNDPLRRGDGIGRSGIKNNILDRGPRKGLPSRDQITSLKGSIKSAKGTHAEPNLPEGDMEEGNAFSKAVVDAKRDGIQKGEKIRVGGKELPLKELDMRLLKGMQGSMKGSNTDSESERNRHKKYGYRSDRDDTGNDDDYDEYGNLKNKKKAAVSDGPKKKGRPTKEKQPERVTAKSYKYKSGRPTKTKEGLDSDGVMMTRPSNMSSEGVSPAEQGEYNDEAGMTKDSLHTIVRNARELEKCLRDNENLPEWVQEKVGQIKGMMTSVTDYILSTHERDAEQHMGREGIAIVPESADFSGSEVQRAYRQAIMLKQFIKDPDGLKVAADLIKLLRYKLQQSNDTLGGVDQLKEKSVSQSQARMMAGAAHNPKFAKKVGVATKVAKEFNKADTGKDISKLPNKVKKTDEANDGNLANNAKPYDKVTQGDVVAGRLGKDEQGGKEKKKKDGIQSFAQRLRSEDDRAERAGKKVTKDIEYDDSSWDNQDGIQSFAQRLRSEDDRAERAGKKVTKDIESDEKKKEKKVAETTTSGSVATGGDAPKASKGMQFGKGVYESLDRQFKQALTESISIESKMQECGDGEMAPAITITADGEEAAKLMMLLKLAGLESQIPKACPTCGGSPCGCDQMVDENAPDWPTNTDTLAADPNLRTYSGGLNGPKSTGQTTVPVVASQLRRQASMEESIALERSLFKTWQNYKG